VWHGIVIGGSLWVVGALPIQEDLQVAGVTWKGRRWRFEGRRRACRVADGVYLTHRGGVVHLKHRCGSP